MSLSIGIVGLPNVGKSTLFNALTGNNILAANYPFATIDPNTGIVPIPDSRLEKLAELYNSKKIIPATVTFVDIAGLVSGASKGEGLGNQFLSHIRTCNAICQVVRSFKDENVLRSSDSKNVKNDIEIINTELVLADLQTVEKRLPHLQKESRSNPKLSPLVKYLEKIYKCLNEGMPIFSDEELMQDDLKDELTKQLQLITMKPIFYLINVDENILSDDEEKNQLAKYVEPARAVFMSAKLEDELKSLDKQDREELLLSYGQKESGLINVIETAYDILGLQSYLTAGEQEVRAWTIHKNATAPQAAGVIHTDFERGFISAQIVDYDDLINAGSLNNAKTLGKVRLEGRNYTMRENDVVEFNFNV